MAKRCGGGECVAAGNSEGRPKRVHPVAMPPNSELSPAEDAFQAMLGAPDARHRPRLGIGCDFSRIHVAAEKSSKPTIFREVHVASESTNFLDNLPEIDACAPKFDCNLPISGRISLKLVDLWKK